jgi:hypothetical protein
VPIVAFIVCAAAANCGKATIIAKHSAKIYLILLNIQKNI